MRLIVYCLFSILVFVSCKSSNLTYLSDLGDQAVFNTQLTDNYEPKIQPGNILSVTMSSQSPETNSLFNNGVVLTNNSIKNTGSSNNLNEGYLVDKNGYVSFPFIGRIQLNGLTKEEATEKLTNTLKKYVKEPVISMRINNFKITVIGEVARPSTILIPGERLNILEALGYVGDLTPFGKRENVLIIRDLNGTRTTNRINLNSKSLLESPYFYLQQNDIVYVEPNKAKGLQSNPRTYNLPIWLSLASFVAFIVSTFR